MIMSSQHEILLSKTGKQDMLSPHISYRDSVKMLYKDISAVYSFDII